MFLDFVFSAKNYLSQFCPITSNRECNIWIVAFSFLKVHPCGVLIFVGWCFRVLGKVAGDAKIDTPREKTSYCIIRLKSRIKQGLKSDVLITGGVNKSRLSERRTGTSKCLFWLVLSDGYFTCNLKPILFWFFFHDIKLSYNISTYINFLMKRIPLSLFIKLKLS